MALIPLCARVIRRSLPEIETINWTDYDLVNSFGKMQASIRCENGINPQNLPSYQDIKIPNPSPSPENKNPGHVSFGPGGFALYKDLNPRYKPHILIPIPTGSSTIFVPVLENSQTGIFMIEIARILKSVSPLVAGPIILVLTTTGVLASIGALGSVSTGGSSFVLSLVSIKSAGLAIIAICLAFNVPINEKALNPASITMNKLFYQHHDMPEQIEYHLENINIVSKDKHQYQLKHNNTCVSIDFQNVNNKGIVVSRSECI